MVTSAKVNMFGLNVGTFTWDQQVGAVIFEYNREFVRSGLEPSPLMMPVQEGRLYSFANLGRETFQGLPGMLADSLPDTYGRALFDKWLSITGRTSGNPVESLCFMGKRCMGALEFEPSLDISRDDHNSYELDALVEVAKEALNEKSAFETNLNQDKKTAISEILRLGTSAGGQRAKAIIAYNKKTGEIRSGQVEAPEGFDYYLIKLDGVSAKAGFRETENFGRLEYSFYRLAKNCGIEMSDCSLVEENGRAHFLTRRFDRINGEKIHMQTLCGIAHYDYRLHLAYSYEQAFNVMRALRLPYNDAIQMFRRMVFNVIIRNQDDHTKNISFLMGKDGKWRLSPAYDMGYSYNPKGGWTSTHQMSINEKFEKITRDDLMAVAQLNNIKEGSSIIDDVCEKAAIWPEIAKECEVPSAMRDSIIPNMLFEL